VKGHLANLALAVAFSVLIWSAIGSHLIEQTEITVDMRIEVPKDVIVRYQDLPSTASVLHLRQGIQFTIQGPREQILRTDQESLEGVLILDEEELRDAFLRTPPHIIVDPKRGVHAPEGLEVVDADPPQLRLELERVEDQMVWVEPGEITGDPAAGYRRGEVTVTPRRVAVRGPSSLLQATYKTLPVDLGGANKAFEADRPLDCPPGVVAQTQVRLRVEILPELETRTLDLPVRLSLPWPETPEGSIEPLPYKIKARESWTVRVTLRGPNRILRDLEDDLDRKRLDPLYQAQLPVAYVPGGELPREELSQPDRNQNLHVDIVGLPPGVEVVEPPAFPVTLVRVSK
jgi:hypothetical protein